MLSYVRLEFRRAACVSALCVSSLLCAVEVSAAVTFRIVTQSGDSAVGAEPGTVLSNFNISAPPSINDSGHTVFLAHITDLADNSSQGDGIWSDRTGTIELVARTGDTAPGTAPGVTFSSIAKPILNDAGQIMFTGLLQGPGVTDDNRFGIWSDASGSLQLVARKGDQAPGLAPGAVFSTIQSPVFNEAGQVAFHSSLNDPSASIPFDQAVWVERNDSLALVARAGDVAPNTEPGTVFLGLSTPLLNDLGQTTFKATLAGPSVLGSNLLGIWSESTGPLDVVVRSGDQAPGTEPGVIYRLDNSTAFSVNNAGDTAFSSLVSGPGIDSTNDRGIWVGTSGALSLITRKGEQAPLALPGVVYTELNDPMISTEGRTVFSGEVSGPGVDNTNNERIWISTEGILKENLRAGLWPKGLINASYSEFSDLVLASDESTEFSGTTAIMATISGPGIDDTNDQAIFMQVPLGGFELVIREGNPFDVNPDPLIDDIRTIVSIDALFGSNEQDSRPTSLNADNQVAFILNFTDDSSAIVVATSGLIHDIEGDLTGDGFVGIDDLNFILTNWNQNVSPGDSYRGDTNGDGYVSLIDLNYVLPYWNNGTPPQAPTSIPEPGMLMLLFAGTGWQLSCRRNRRQVA